MAAANAGERRILMEFPKTNGEYDTSNPVPIRVSEVSKYMKEEKGRISRKGMSGVQRAITAAADWMPLAGGIVGGATLGAGGGALSGGIGAIPAGAVGAGLGQAAGQGLREAIYRMEGLGDAPGTVLGQGALGAASGAGGVILGKGLALGGNALMNTALGKSGQKLAETAATALKERIPVGKLMELGETVWSKIPGIRSLGQTGMQKLQPIVDAYGAARDRIIAKLEARGYQTTYQSFVKEAEAYVQKLRDAGNNTAAEQAKARMKELLTEVKDLSLTKVKSRLRNPGELFGVRQAQDYVTGANNTLDNFYANQALGRRAPLDPPHQITKIFGDTYRDWLRTIDEAELKLANGGTLKGIQDKTLEALNKRFGSLINLRNVLREAEAKGALGRLQETSMGTAGAGMAIGAAGQALTGGGSAVGTGAAVGAGLGAFPGLASRTALTMTGPAGQFTGRYAIPYGGQYFFNPSLGNKQPAERSSYFYPSQVPADSNGGR